MLLNRHKTIKKIQFHEVQLKKKKELQLKIININRKNSIKHHEEAPTEQASFHENFFSIIKVIEEELTVPFF